MDKRSSLFVRRFSDEEKGFGGLSDTWTESSFWFLVVPFFAETILSLKISQGNILRKHGSTTTVAATWWVTFLCRSLSLSPTIPSLNPSTQLSLPVSLVSASLSFHKQRQQGCGGRSRARHYKNCRAHHLRSKLARSMLADISIQVWSS